MEGKLSAGVLFAVFGSQSLLSSSHRTLRYLEYCWEPLLEGKFSADVLFAVSPIVPCYLFFQTFPLIKQSLPTPHFPCGCKAPALGNSGLHNLSRAPGYPPVGVQVGGGHEAYCPCEPLCGCQKLIRFSDDGLWRAETPMGNKEFPPPGGVASK